MTQELTGVLNLDLVGGLLCLDFTNTVHDNTVKTPRDELQTYADLARWSGRVGTIGPEETERLLALAESQPQRAASVLERARSIRRLIFDIFSAIADGKDPKKTHLESLSESYAEAMRHGRIRKSSSGFQWGWETAPSPMAAMLWPVVASAVQLMASPELARVSKCASDRCTWLFIDKSKNHSRRWCEMGSCGNRAKSRRHYRRTRRAGNEPAGDA